MKLSRRVGSTSEIWQIFIADSSSTTGAGLAGLVFNSASLTAYYHRDTDTTATAISLATMTVGTFTSSGFKEIDATNMPGWYQFCPPNAALASGAKSCGFHLKGATNMAPLPIEVDLQTQATTGIPKNAILAGFTFLMTDSTTHTPKTGLTVTATRSIDGAAFGACANSVSEVSSGVYSITLAAADLNGTCIMLRFSASNADDRDILIVTVV